LYFDVEAHIGVDTQTKVILAATPGNAHHSMCLPDLFLWECGGSFYLPSNIYKYDRKDKTDLRRIKGEQAQAVFYAGRAPSRASVSSA
jgi:hypothetical protein